MFLCNTTLQPISRRKEMTVSVNGCCPVPERL
jgi:hypothetical protein